jgi:aconitate hydratase
VLTVTEMLRKAKVVGKFVEFFGEGTASLAVPDRATIGNMAPEYGATMGFFPVDEATVDYLRATGRTADEIDRFQAYFKAQGLWGVPEGRRDRLHAGADARPRDDQAVARGPEAPAGPHRDAGAQEHVHVALQQADRRERLRQEGDRPHLAHHHRRRLRRRQRRRADRRDHVVHEHVEPGRAARRGPAREEGGRARAHGQPARQDLARAGLARRHRLPDQGGLLPYLAKLGFDVAAYGCTTCIGNAGDLRPSFNEAIAANDLVCAAVLSGNRNFEARIHPNLKANFLASPPLVVAYAIAGPCSRTSRPSRSASAPTASRSC